MTKKPIILMSHGPGDTVDGQENPPLIGPFEGINKEISRFVSNFYIKYRVLKLTFSAFSRGPGGFRELREAGRKHFHLSWYLSVPVVRSYGQKPWGGFVYNEYGM